MRKNGKSLISAEWFARTNGLEWPEDNEMNHDVLIKSDGPTTASIYIDGAPIDGVVAYRIDRSLDPVQRVTFTILAENVTVENLTP